MSYQPGIPTGSVPLNIDYKNLQTNFQQLDTIFGIDHIPYSQLPNQGYHTKVHLVPAAPPAFTAGTGQLVSTTTTDINTDQSLYWLTGANRLLQLTMNFDSVKAGNGYTFLPGGIIFQWGITPLLAAGSYTTVTFATSNKAFPNACLSVMLTRISDQGTSPSANSVFVRDSSVTSTGFQITNTTSSSSQFAYWWAIGY